MEEIDSEQSGLMFVTFPLVATAGPFIDSRPQLVSTTNTSFDPWFPSEVTLVPIEDKEVHTTIVLDSMCHEVVKGDDCVAQKSFLRETAIAEAHGSASEECGELVNLSFPDGEDMQGKIPLSEKSVYGEQFMIAGYHGTTTTPIICVNFVNLPNCSVEAHADSEVRRSYEFSNDIIGATTRPGHFLDIPSSAWCKVEVDSSSPVGTHTPWISPPVRFRPSCTRSVITLDRRPTSLSVDPYRRRGRAGAAIPRSIAEDELSVPRVSGESLDALGLRDIDTMIAIELSESMTYAIYAVTLLPAVGAFYPRAYEAEGPMTVFSWIIS
ncbi:hypothetical protein J3A83DRAFT_4186438 [Scleroderma citrinum]